MSRTSFVRTSALAAVAALALAACSGADNPAAVDPPSDASVDVVAAAMASLPRGEYYAYDLALDVDQDWLDGLTGSERLEAERIANSSVTGLVSPTAYSSTIRIDGVDWFELRQFGRDSSAPTYYARMAIDELKTEFGEQEVNRVKIGLSLIPDTEIKAVIAKLFEGEWVSLTLDSDELHGQLSALFPNAADAASGTTDPAAVRSAITGELAALGTVEYWQRAIVAANEAESDARGVTYEIAVAPSAIAETLANIVVAVVDVVPELQDQAGDDFRSDMNEALEAAQAGLPGQVAGLMVAVDNGYPSRISLDAGVLAEEFGATGDPTAPGPGDLALTLDLNFDDPDEAERPEAAASAATEDIIDVAENLITSGAIDPDDVTEDFFTSMFS